MPADLRIALTGTEMRALLKIDGVEVEDEVWKLDRKATRSEIEEIARCLFADAYQVIQYAAHEK